MPTYDRDLVIEVCHDLINRAMRNEFDAIPDLAYSKIYRDQEAAIRSLLAAQEAATQEIERLTRERDEARAEWQGADGKADWYVEECERLRKLVGEACDGRESVDLSDHACVSNGDRGRDWKRLAAIRHAAGLGDE